MAMSSRSLAVLVLSLPLAVLTLLAYNNSSSPQELVARPQVSSQPSDNSTKSRHDDTQRSHSSMTNRHDDAQRFTGWLRSEILHVVL